MSCRRLREKSIRVKDNDLKRLFNSGVFVSMAYSGASVLNISKEKCVHGLAERQFNVVTHEVRFEKFECNYRCTINSMNSVFMAENANGPWTELSDSMYQMPKKKKNKKINPYLPYLQKFRLKPETHIFFYLALTSTKRRTKCLAQGHNTVSQTSNFVF